MTRRWFLYVPEINPHSFEFFFFKGDTGRSWSLRHYAGGRQTTRYAREFTWTAEQVLAMARRPGNYAVIADRHQTNDHAWYEEWINKLNNRYLREESTAKPEFPPPSESSVGFPQFPIVDLDQLLALPKARKREDLRRMFTSVNSEDYVTWNIIRGLMRRSDWWPKLVATVHETGDAEVPPPDLIPSVDLWRLVTTPPGYEKASRERMAASSVVLWQERARNPDPVEGRTEVDVVFDDPSFLVFVEAKLGSDMSARTTYDPARNQIVRNIDCLIEHVGDRTPYFWMFVKDRGDGRAYMQLLRRYANDPQELNAHLPHRHEVQHLLATVAQRTATILWSDLLRLLPESEELGEVIVELKRRVG
jgi:hypothetical protein